MVGTRHQSRQDGVIVQDSSPLGIVFLSFGFASMGYGSLHYRLLSLLCCLPDSMLLLLFRLSFYRACVLVCFFVAAKPAAQEQQPL